MKKYATYHLVLIDVAGGAALVFCLLVSLWLVLVRADETRTHILRQQEIVTSAKRDLAALREVSLTQQSRLEQARVELSTSGQLPTRTPIEPYSQEVLRLAGAHALRVMRQHPVPSRHYPCLLEQRYAYEVSGSTANIVRFLAAIESTNYWADISFLKLDAKAAAAPPAERTRLASITVSMFSAPRAGAEGEGDG